MIFDIIVVLLYFALIIYLSLQSSKEVVNNDDALKGGSGFGLLTAAVGRTANMAGGPATIGNATYGYQAGLGGVWFAVSNIIAMWLSAPFAARIYRTMKEAEVFTIGGYIGYRFGKFTQVFAGFTNFLAYLGFVASNILATGTVLSIFFEINLKISIIIAAIITGIYTVLGGLKSVYKVNLIQVFIMLFGFFVVLFPFSLNEVGGVVHLFEKLPSTHTQISFSNFLVIIGSIILPTIVTGFTTQAGYIAIYSSKNSKVGWKSTIFAGVIYAFIVFPIIISGMAAHLLLPGTEPQSILTTLITKILPSGLVGLLAAAIMSATMSTAAACSLNALTCFREDVLKPLKLISKEKEESIIYTRILLVVITLIALSFAILLPSVIKLLLIGYSLATGGLLVPVFATMLWKRATSLGVSLSMIFGGGSFLILKTTSLSIPPLFISLLLSVTMLIVGSYFSKKQSEEILKYYFIKENE